MSTCSFFVLFLFELPKNRQSLAFNILKIFSLVQMPFWRYLLLFAKLELQWRRFLSIRFAKPNCIFECLIFIVSQVVNFIISCPQHIANLAGNKNLVLPVPAFNVINGGSHAGNKLAMQVVTSFYHSEYAYFLVILIVWFVQPFSCKFILPFPLCSLFYGDFSPCYI